MDSGFLNKTLIAPNTIADWLWFAGIMLVGVVLMPVLSRVGSRLLCRLLKKDPSSGVGHQELFKLVRKPWNLFVILISLYIACQQLTWPPEWKMASPDKLGIRMVLLRVLGTGIIIAFTGILLRLTDFFGLILKQRAGRTAGQEDDQLIPFLREAIKVVIVIFSFFFTLGAVFHINVASLIAGLGIGGIAVALAAKESLENLIGSFAIFLDKPFSIGDNIQLGTQSGQIERIGFRSTRIRMEDRSMVIMPNRKMVESETINLTRRNARRVLSRISLAVNTTPEQLQTIVTSIRKHLEERADLCPGESRVNFFEYTPYSVDIQILYFIPDLEYDTSLVIREQVNFMILESIRSAGANMANVTATVR